MKGMIRKERSCGIWFGVFFCIVIFIVFDVVISGEDRDFVEVVGFGDRRSYISDRVIRIRVVLRSWF